MQENPMRRRALVFISPALMSCKLLQTQQSSPQITNGTVADERVFRQGVIRIRSVFMDAGTTVASTCTGTLIHTPNEKLNECVGLSAAHCFANTPAGAKHAVEFVSRKGTVVASLAPSAVHVHPLFNISGTRVSASMSAVDVAVMRFPCSDLSFLQAAKILDHKNVPVGANLIIAGFGLTMSEAQASLNAERGLQGQSVQPRASSVLMQTQMRLHRVDFPERPTAGVFALAGADGRSSCNGDSGGPAFFDSGGELYLVASTSAGPVQCEKSTAVYTITSVHADWINSMLGGQIIKVADRVGAGEPAAPEIQQPTEKIRCAGVGLRVKAVTRSWGTILKLIDKDSTQISDSSLKCNLKNESLLCLSEIPNATGTGHSTSKLAEPVPAEGCEKFSAGRQVYIYRPDFQPAN
jgi:hypothetical protein